MKPYNPYYNREKKKSLKEQLSFLTVYKHGDEDLKKLIDEFINKFNAPRTEIYRALATLFTTLANEADSQAKEKEKVKK